MIENIDIGGPTMIRAAAKNSAFAAVVVDPEDYAAVLERAARLRRSGLVAARRAHAARRQGVRLTARYDVAISTGSRRTPTRASRHLARRLREGQPTCATARTRTSRPPSTRAWARRRTCSTGVTPAARQGALLQQPARPQLRPRARGGVRRAGLRDRQAQQPLRLCRRRDGPVAPTNAPSPATRRAPTAA